MRVSLVARHRDAFDGQWGAAGSRKRGIRVVRYDSTGKSET